LPPPASPGKVNLHWQIDSAEDNFGFYLERSQATDPVECPICHRPHLKQAEPAEGPWERVNEDLILGVGTTSEIHRFSYTDEGLERGKDFWYRLHEVSMAGVSALKGTVPAHCRTEEEQTARDRRSAMAGLFSEDAEAFTSPVASGEWLAFAHPLEGDAPIHLIGDWRGWEESPLPLERVPGTFWSMVDEPLADLPLTIQYLFLVGEAGSTEHRPDPNNPLQEMDSARGERVSRFTRGEAR
jgi:hypothetical protein